MVYEYKDDKIPLRTQYVTLAILIINVIVFLLQYTDPTGYMYIYEFAFIPNEFFSGIKVWTIITSMFMHGDPIHILFNMWFFLVVADNVEKETGHFTFLVIYLIAGICGSLLHGIFATFVPLLGSIPSLGASGAIYGIMAIYGILFPRIQLMLVSGRIPRRITAGTLIIIYFITELTYALSSFQISGTAHFAHIGGFLAGAIFAFVFKATNRYS
ncbi:MAG: rhomboid family intramembrane serine protease [Candidatus Lokiarchaeota archaeon]|nr:rhomboid family intramembrane serine protease [Candidatus Lokiarchaeota archaeon]MBD3201120.1 rhomboid family intramembrane serine protease [Candidatus Lokiarchaeota archaeon]